jgi:hypothetical protein
MAERPTGTVSFLFTDIEGSTRLLQQLRDRYDDVLSTHARLLREAIDRTFSRLALELERDLVPAAPFATNASSNFFSARIGCRLFHPVFVIDLAALCCGADVTQGVRVAD